MNRYRKFFKLRRDEKILFIEAFFLVSAARMVLWFVPFRLLKKKFAGNLKNENGGADADWRKLEKISNSVVKVSRFVPGASCLTQALAALWLIKFNGQSSELKIGVAKNAQAKLIAHAWLESGGRIVIGKMPEHQTYTILDSAKT